MGIDNKLKKVAQSYKIYLEKKQSFNDAKRVLNNDLNKVCSYFTCKNCPALNICVKVGVLGDDLNERH